MANYILIDALNVAILAEAGAAVRVEVIIKNLYNYGIRSWITGEANGREMQFGGEHWLAPWERAAFEDSFIMPNNAVEVHVTTWYMGTTGEWIPDDNAYKPVALSGAPPPPPPEEYSGNISRKELEYDGTKSNIPVY